jgi:3-hydroxybutyryl-CoA dehydratase
MNDFYVKSGDSVSFAKTVGETDIYLFAGITGDFSVNHVNEQYMAESKYRHRIAHGALLVGYMSTASTEMAHRLRSPAGGGEVPVSLGYDRIRFLAPVFFGDTVTVDYVIDTIDAERRRATADIKITNQGGELVAVATHVLKWVSKS